MTKANDKKLYQHVLDSSIFTTKQLNELGFSSKELTDLTKEDKLIRKERGIYEISTDQLLIYSIRAKDEGILLKSQNIIEMCYNREPNNKTICFQLIRIKLMRKDMNNIEQCIMSLYNTENPNQVADANLFLYLLNYLTELSPNLSQKASKIEVEDIMLKPGYKKFGMDIFTQNTIRNYLYNYQFSQARKVYQDYIDEIGAYSLKDASLEQLITRCNQKLKWLIQHQVKLSKTNQIDKLLELYENEESKRNLKAQELMVYLTAKDLYKIQQTGEIPTPKNYHEPNILSLVETKNYDIALQEHTKYLETKNFSKEENPLYLLLNEICSQINRNISNKETQLEIDKLYNKVTSSGDIVVLYNLSQEEITELTSHLKKYHNIATMVIEEADTQKKGKHLVLRQTEYLGDIYIPSIINQARNEYFEGNYDESIRLYKKVLKTYKPKGSTYSGLAHAYIQKGLNNLALDYFIVAKHIQKYEKYPYSYDDIIKELTLSIQNSQETTDSTTSNYKIYQKNTSN